MARRALDLSQSSAGVYPNLPGGGLPPQLGGTVPDLPTSGYPENVPSPDMLFEPGPTTGPPYVDPRTVTRRYSAGNKPDTSFEAFLEDYGPKLKEETLMKAFKDPNNMNKYQDTLDLIDEYSGGYSDQEILEDVAILQKDGVTRAGAINAFRMMYPEMDEKKIATYINVYYPEEIEE